VKFSSYITTISATDVKIWGRGVDTNSFSPSHRTQQFRRTHNIPDNCPVILFVGRLVPEKRIDIFVDVIRRLNTKNINFRAVVVGAGPSDGVVQSIKNTIHLGWLDGQNLREAYASSDIFLFPSSVETFGNVTLEAAASGLPLVVEAHCSGHLVKDGVNGYACETGSVDSFYEGTLALLLDANKRKSYSDQSIIMSKTMDETKIVRQMLRHYECITNEFEDSYGRKHQNRDKKFKNQDSFLLGMDPRPLGFGTTCAILVNTMLFIGWLLKVLKWCKEKHAMLLSHCRIKRKVSLLPTTSENQEDVVRKEGDALISHKIDGNEDVGKEGKRRGLLIDMLVRCLDSRFFLRIVLFLLVILRHFFCFMSWLKFMCIYGRICKGRNKSLRQKN